MSDDERLGAFLDGELDPTEAAELEKAAARDPALRQRLAAMRERDELVRRSLDDHIGDDVPDRFLQTIDRGLAKPAAAIPAANDNRLRWRVGGAVAASLALGLVLGTQVPLSRPADGLADALERTASGQSAALVTGEQMTPELTFARQGGGWCRQFRLEREGSDPRVGLACRDGRWTIEIIHPIPAQAGTGGYVTASGDDDPYIEDLASRLRAGDPVSANDEKQIIARRWSE